MVRIINIWLIFKLSDLTIVKTIALENTILYANVPANIAEVEYRNTGVYNYIIKPSNIISPEVVYENSVYSVEENFVEQTEVYIPAQLTNVRKKRNDLLLETDWTQFIDINIKYKKEPFLTDMRVYRQALRDLPETIDPLDPVYPTPPTYPA